ncbi:MAG: aspartate/glutamate racemase family protein [Bryobacterales bacterium]|nr:aspartate/glutamate racemase family protein [Bryobacterales bacterium]
MYRKIGILGGMSPESTTTYYEHITRSYTARFGDFGYPEILIYSVRFQQFVQWQKQGRWTEAALAMADALERLRLAGADFGLIATNTMHIVFEEVQAATRMPLLSIMDATAQAIRAAGLQVVGMLGTVFTMREKFFREALERWGIEMLAPASDDQARVNSIIYQELCRAEIRPESRRECVGIIEKLRTAGAQGLVLGCTELPLLLSRHDSPLPLFDTTLLHAERALEYAIEPGSYC